MLKLIRLSFSIYWGISRWRTLSYFLFIVYHALIPIIFGYIGGKVVVDAITQGLITGVFDTGLIYSAVLASLALWLLDGFVTSGETLVESYLGRRFDDQVRLRLGNKLLSLDNSMHESSDFQDKLRNVQEEAIPRLAGYLKAIRDSITSAISIVLNVIIIFSHPLLGVLALVVIVPSYFINVRKSAYELKVHKENIQLNRRRGYFLGLLQGLDMLPEMKVGESGNYLARRSKEYVSELFIPYMNVRRANATFSVSQSILMVISNLGSMLYLITLVMNRVITLGDYGFLQNRYNNFRGEFRMIVGRIEQVKSDGKYIQDLVDILDMEPTIVPGIGVKLDSDRLTIELKNVWFKYPGSKRYVLKNVNMTINDGEKIAFVGPNGAGKTTMVKLLLRFYDVNKGEILINGINIKDIDIATLYSKVGLLTQNFNHYNLTIAENIAINTPEKVGDKKALEAAANKSGAKSFIDDYKKKYNQMLGKQFEDGVELSGGQWQKIALARAYMTDSEILILDEPTAAIDARAEAEIFSKLRELGNGKTLVLISHRFSTVRQVDKVYVIDKGGILEQGSHQELMKLNGVYAELYTLQAEMYR